MQKSVLCSISQVMLTHMHTTKPISRIFSCTSGTNLFAHAYRIFMKQRKRAKKVKKNSWKIVYTGPRYQPCPSGINFTLSQDAQLYQKIHNFSLSFTHSMFASCLIGETWTSLIVFISFRFQLIQLISINFVVYCISRHQGCLMRSYNHSYNVYNEIKDDFQFPVKFRGPILRVTSSETRSVCVKQALNTRR